MTPTTLPSAVPATLDDLMGVKGKAELIAGRIVRYMPTGLLPNRVARRIVRSLEDYVPSLGRGEACTDSLGYAMRPPLPSGRQSFSPDASFYDGPLPADLMKFVDGPPTFAAEVRSESDYSPAKDRDYAAERRDDFFAGTLAVWDVDPVAETITCYRAADPLTPAVFRRGDAADAEPAVPGWRVAVDAVFG